jgi:hypothetical protein
MVADQTIVFGFFVMLNHKSPFHLCVKQNSSVLLERTLMTALETRAQSHACCQSLVDIFVLKNILKYRQYIKLC